MLADPTKALDWLWDWSGYWMIEGPDGAHCCTTPMEVKTWLDAYNERNTIPLAWDLTTGANIIKNK